MISSNGSELIWVQALLSPKLDIILGIISALAMTALLIFVWDHLAILGLTLFALHLFSALLSNTPTLPVLQLANMYQFIDNHLV
jgi:hypothetical protein